MIERFLEKLPRRILYGGLYESAVVLRILVPLLIFVFPFPVILASLFLDAIDWDLAKHRVLVHLRYEIVDKFLDYWWYVIVLVYIVINLSNYTYIAIALLAFRAIGDAFYIIKLSRKYLFYFPNFYENFFFIIFLGTYFPQLHFILEGKNFIIVLAVSFISKIIQEYWLHNLDGSYAHKWSYVKSRFFPFLR